MNKRTTVTWLAAIGLLATLSIALLIKDHTHDQIEDARADASEAAERSVPKILTYKSSTVATDLTRAERLLTGTFKSDFAHLANDTIIPTARKRQVSTSASVREVGVIHAESPRRVTLLMFVNQTTTSRAAKVPRLDGSRIKVTMSKVGDHWLVSNFAPL